MVALSKEIEKTRNEEAKAILGPRGLSQADDSFLAELLSIVSYVLFAEGKNGQSQQS